jgi:origin recognition complex subunit 3
MISQQNRTIMASLTSKECPNLKTALKLLVMRLTEDPDVATKDRDAVDEDDTQGDTRFDKRLRYDFDILADYCRKQAKVNSHINELSDLRVIISIEDADSFDIGILSGLVRVIQSYVTLVPFKLILSVATSLRVFEEKLPRECVRMIKGTAFHAGMGTEIVQILDDIVFNHRQGGVILGPKLFNGLIERQTQSMESVDAFVSSLKYIWMSHYYANPFSIASSHRFSDYLTIQHCSAIRLLGSFRRLVESETESKHYDEAAS